MEIEHFGRKSNIRYMVSNCLRISTFKVTCIRLLTKPNLHHHFEGHDVLVRYHHRRGHIPSMDEMLVSSRWWSRVSLGLGYDGKLLPAVDFEGTTVWSVNPIEVVDRESLKTIVCSVNQAVDVGWVTGETIACPVNLTVVVGWVISPAPVGNYCAWQWVTPVVDAEIGCLVVDARPILRCTFAQTVDWASASQPAVAWLSQAAARKFRWYCPWSVCWTAGGASHDPGDAQRWCAALSRPAQPGSVR